MSNTKYYIYDLETYRMAFTCVISDEDGNTVSFEISNRKREASELRAFLGKIYAQKAKMVGFNNIGFDYPVLHYFLNNKGLDAEDVYNKAMEIINSPFDDRFKHIIWERDIMIPQVDLFKIHHFDNKAKQTSLKMLEFNMRSENIEDLPYHPSSDLTSEMIDEILEYNKHDVLQTLKFFNHSKSAIEFRGELGEKYGRDFTNFNDTKIGAEFFIMELEKENPSSCFRKEGNRKVPNQTHRKILKLRDAVFDYVEFKRPEFNAIKDWFMQQEIKETKGIFTDILESDLGDVAKYANMKTKRKKLPNSPSESDKEKWLKKYPSCWFEEKELKSGKVSYHVCWNVAETLNVVVEGLQYDYGTGGLHGAMSGKIFESDDEVVIKSYDVNSFYPHLSIQNNVYPEHLSQKFCEVYENIYNERKKYPKGTALNLMFKLCLNSVYGNSNNQFSPFYDPLFTMKITINGQLLLCMLAERLLEIPNLKIIMVNTDGLEFVVPRKYEEESTKICRQWEKDTKLTLEDETYEKLCLNNVNNYLGIFSNGKLKRKGAYEYDSLGWHQNHSALVIKKAVEQNLVYGIDIEEFIKNHDDIYDFMLRVKIPRTSRLVTVDDDGIEHPEQNISRYYISKNGRKLTKIMPPLPDKEEERYIGVDKEWKVTVCNDISKFNDDINYYYYMSEALKLTDVFK